MFANFFEDFQAGKAESLEAVWRGARFVAPPRKRRTPVGLRSWRCRRHWSSVSTAQGPATMATFGPPTRTSPEGVRDATDGGIGFGVEGDEFIGLGGGNAFDDAGHGLENAEIERVFIAGDADGGAAGTGERMRFQAEKKGFDFLADGTNFGFRGVGLHDD